MYTFPSVKMVHQVYKEQKVKNQERALNSEQNRLKLKYEMITSPEEMEKRALARGFARSGRENVVYVEKRWSAK
jgi:hypothetical protein